MENDTLQAENYLILFGEEVVVRHACPGNPSNLVQQSKLITSTKVLFVGIPQIQVK